MATEKTEGVADRLRHAAESAKAADQLATLWQVLIPPPAREAIRSGKLNGIAISPQGHLSFLPFEAMIVDQSAGNLQYLLDVGPPVFYVPSVTLLVKLNQWKVPEPKSAKQPVLTLGDPQYNAPGSDPADQRQRPVSLVASQYERASSRPTPLPFTANETKAVADAFIKHKIGVAQLTKNLATEGNMRLNSPGRRVLHFACHGSSSSLYGNSFGALAVAEGPSAKTNTADDGYLTVAEIY
jgi:CHAT domain-containing protein